MGRIVLVVLVTFLTSSLAFGSFADADAAREAVLAGGEMSQADLKSAHALLESAVDRSPKDVDTLHAFVVACQRVNDWENGLPAARKLEEMAPDVADHQYLLGNALFETIDEVSFFNKGARASAGRKAYQRAVELEPKHVGARSGLFYFYMEAPGFAGGSKKKAKAIAEEMVREPENAKTGYELLMALAAKEKDWDRFDELFNGLLSTAETSEARAGILLTATYTALFTREDYERGMELAAEYREAAGEGQGGYATSYFEGVALHGLDRHSEAVEKFEKVLEVEPDAKNTRWLLAESCEELGRDAEAAGHYAEFAERFGDDDRARAAKKKAKRLR